MLMPTPSAADEIDRILTSLESGELDHTTAGARIVQLDPEEGAGYLLLAGSSRELQSPADMDRSESLLWEALQRRPCGPTVYMGLAEVRTARTRDDSLAKSLTVLAMWKLSMSPEISPEVAELFRETMSHPDFDWTDPESYSIVATAWEEEIEEQGEPPEAAARLLPYRLFNRVQLEFQAITPDLAGQIVDNAAACAPVFRGVLWEWGRHDEAVDAVTLRVVCTFLGEIAGPEVLPELLGLATHEDPAMALHAHWALHRLARRFPAEALAAFRSAAQEANVSLRCSLAEQLGLLPDIPGREEALLYLLQDFGRLAQEEDAPYLLLAVCDALEHIGRTLQARENLLRFERSLSREGREWLREMRNVEGGFVPMLAAYGVPDLSLEDVVVNRVLVDDLPEEEDPWDDGEEQAAEPSPPKPARNDPCWCGSGKKYKKCHLDEDQEKARSSRESGA